jgi:hypothetical protein
VLIKELFYSNYSNSSMIFKARKKAARFFVIVRLSCIIFELLFC